MRTPLLCLFLTASAYAGNTCVATGAASVSSATNWSACGGVAPVSGVDKLSSSGGAITIDINNFTVGDGTGNAITLTSTGSVTAAQNITALIAGGISAAPTSRCYYAAGAIYKSTMASHVVFACPFEAATVNPATFANPGTIDSDLTLGGVESSVSAPYLDLTNLKVRNQGYMTGGTQTFGVTFTGGGTGNTLTLSQVTLDNTCGLKIGSGWGVNDQWVGTNFTTKNTPAGCKSWDSGSIGYVLPAVGKVKQMTNVSLDAVAVLGSFDEHWTNALFWNKWTETSFVNGTGPVGNVTWAHPYIVDGYSLVRVPWQATCTTWSQAASNAGLGIKGAQLDHVLIVGDSSTCISGGAPSAAIAKTSGTATSATSTTLTDSTKSGVWTLNQWASASATSYFVVITGGAGAGQVQTIESNTTTGQITQRYPWDTQPDNTSTYAIYGGAYNPHWTNGPTLTTGNTLTHQYVMAGLWGGADNNGDLWHGMTCPSGAGGSGVAINSGLYILDYTALFPSLAHDNSGALITSNNCSYKVRHATYFTGAQSVGLNEGGLNQTAGALEDFSGNLSWSGTRIYKTSGGGSAVSGLGPWLLTDEVLGSGATDIVKTNCYGGSASCADYNGDFRALQTGRAATDQPGSNPAYNLKTSVIMGAHDVRSTDPQFPDPWVTPQKWAQSLGLDTGVSDPIAILPDLYARMMDVFDFTPTDSRFTSQALWNYLAAAMTPANTAFRGAGPSRSDIGAFGLAPVPPGLRGNAILRGTARMGFRAGAGSSLSWTSLSNSDWTSLTNSQWTSLAN